MKGEIGLKIFTFLIIVFFASIIAILISSELDYKVCTDNGYKRLSMDVEVAYIDEVRNINCCEFETILNEDKTEFEYIKTCEVFESEVRR